MESLAYVDHFLTELRDEIRPEVLGLACAGAGAWFGRKIQEHFGAQWLGRREDPRSLRLFLTPVFVHLAPCDIALEVALGESLEPDDPRIPPGPSFDASFNLDRRSTDSKPESAAQWMSSRLSELRPLDEGLYFSLTGRLETLELIAQMLAQRAQTEGLEPHDWTLADYLSALSFEPGSGRN